MPSAQKPAGAEDAERALSREQPVAADAAAPTPANQGSASAEGVEFIEEDLQQDPPGNGDLLGKRTGFGQVATAGCPACGYLAKAAVLRPKTIPAQLPLAPAKMHAPATLL